MRHSVLSNRAKKASILTAVACLLLGAGSVMADATLSPEVKAILDKSVTALGGAEAIKKIDSRIVTAKIEVVGAGVTLDVTSYQKAPGSMSVYIASAQAGDQNKGTDGVHAWMVDAANGPRLLDGSEKTEMIQEANLQSDRTPEKEYSKIDLAGEEAVDGKPAVKLACENAEGKKSTLYYDKESGLLVRRDSVETTAQGPIAMSATMGDYRDAGGVKVPYTSTVKFGPGALKITTEKVESNVEIPAEKLAPPPDVAKLIADEKAAPPATPSAPAMPPAPEAPPAPAMPK